MPACAHFLRGACAVEDCPYLHVNLPPGAPLCAAFAAGHCPAGARCRRKHFTARMARDERAQARSSAAPGRPAVGGPKRPAAAAGLPLPPPNKRPRPAPPLGGG